MSVLEAAMEELKALPPHKLEEAVRYLHSLREESLAERNAALLKTAGTLSKEEADEWDAAIREDCRKIDDSQW